jgi:hypothetical protein
VRFTTIKSQYQNLHPEELNHVSHIDPCLSAIYKDTPQEIKIQGTEPTKNDFKMSIVVDPAEESSANTSRIEIAGVSPQPIENHHFDEMTFRQLLKLTQNPVQSADTVQGVITASKMKRERPHRFH